MKSRINCDSLNEVMDVVCKLSGTEYSKDVYFPVP